METLEGRITNGNDRNCLYYLCILLTYTVIFIQVEKEIADCHGMEGWIEQCQVTACLYHNYIII